MSIGSRVLFNWPSVIQRVRLPAPGETVNSMSFVVPDSAKSVAIFVPDLAGTGTTLKIQSLTPTEFINAGGPQLWLDVSTFDLTDGTVELLDGIPENGVTTIPCTATGGGNLRFVSTADQSASPVTVHVIFNMD